MNETDLKKKILYIDMDGVIADFEKRMFFYRPEWNTLTDDEKGNITDEVCGADPKFFEELEPMPDAIESVKRLANHFEVYFLSAAMWNVPISYTAKRIWIGNHFGDDFKKRLIISHHKHLNIGDYLIDDRKSHGAGDFKGEHIHFKTDPKFPNWQSLEKYLVNLA
jgi:5'(3')-deoxyribonucleotidase